MPATQDDPQHPAAPIPEAPLPSAPPAATAATPPSPSPAAAPASVPPTPADSRESRQVVTSDPARIRALTHPLRLELLDLLDDHGPSTATRCAELTGESVASCSFHLRTLARHGFIEPAERTGREKPWQVVGQGRRTRWDRDEPGSLRAVTELARITLERESARVADWLDRASTMSPEWLDASTMTQSTFWATADELAALTTEIEALTVRFAGRSEDPALRPDGAHSAHLWAVAHADPDPALDGGTRRGAATRSGRPGTTRHVPAAEHGGRSSPEQHEQHEQHER